MDLLLDEPVSMLVFGLTSKSFVLVELRDNLFVG